MESPSRIDSRITFSTFSKQSTKPRKSLYKISSVISHHFRQPSTPLHFFRFSDGRLTSITTLQFSTFTFELMHSTPGIRTDLFARSPSETLLTDFFGGVSQVDLLIDDDVPLGVSVDVGVATRINATELEGADGGMLEEGTPSTSRSSLRRKRNLGQKPTSTGRRESRKSTVTGEGERSKMWIAGVFILSAQVVAVVMSRRRTAIVSA